MLLILRTIRNTHLSGKRELLCVETSSHCDLQVYRTCGSVQNLIYDLHRVTEKMNILYKMKGRKANLIGHILRRNCLRKRIMEGKTQGTRRRGRSSYKLLNDSKKERRYWTLKMEALGSNLWRNRCGRGYGPIARMA